MRWDGRSWTDACHACRNSPNGERGRSRRRSSLRDGHRTMRTDNNRGGESGTASACNIDCCCCGGSCIGRVAVEAVDAVNPFSAQHPWLHRLRGILRCGCCRFCGGVGSFNCCSRDGCCACGFGVDVCSKRGWGDSLQMLGSTATDERMAIDRPGGSSSSSSSSTCACQLQRTNRGSLYLFLLRSASLRSADSECSIAMTGHTIASAFNT